MKNMIYYSLAVLLVVLSVVDVGSGIECYVCRSETDPDCEGVPAPKYLTNCSSTVKSGMETKSCRKIDNNVDFTVLGQKPTKRIIRQCAARVDQDRACYYRAGFGGRANVCDCFENRCNHGNRNFLASLLSVAISAIAALVFL